MEQEREREKRVKGGGVQYKQRKRDIHTNRQIQKYALFFNVPDCMLHMIFAKGE